MKKDTNWMTKIPVAHRGLHDNKQVPENSLLAFQHAVDSGYGIELDVHLTKDGTLVVHHDANIKRTTGLDMNVVDINSNKLEDYKLFNTTEHIPTFNDMLNLVNGKVGLVIEIKRTKHPELVCPAIIDRLAKYKGNYSIESFDIGVVNYMHKHYPSVILGQLYDSSYQRIAALICKQHKKVDFMAICIDNVNSKAYIKIKSKNPNILIIPWTVRTKEQQELAIKNCNNYIFETNLKNPTYIEPPKITK